MSKKEGKFISAIENFRLFGDCSTSEDDDDDYHQSTDNVKTEIVNGMRLYNERLKLRRDRRNKVIRPLWWKADKDVDDRLVNMDGDRVIVEDDNIKTK